MSVRTVPGALDILNQKLGGNAGDIPASSTKEYALEKIYKTLGGEESLEGVNTTSEIIEKIAGVAQGGGGSSDFSTAEVTLNIGYKDGGTSTDHFASNCLAYLIPTNIYTGYQIPENYNDNGVPVIRELESNSNTLDVLLSNSGKTNGAALILSLAVIDSNGITHSITGSNGVSGGITWDSDSNVYNVTGDGEINRSL